MAGWTKQLLGVSTIVVLISISLISAGPLLSASEVILGKAGRIVITQKDFEEVLKKYERLRKGQPLNPEEKKEALNSLINGALISMEGEKAKLGEDPDIKAKLKIYRMELLSQEYVNRMIASKVTVRDEEVKEKMKDNPHLVPKETLRMKEIVVHTELEAEEIYKELKEGKDFSVLAASKSIANTAAAGGHMKQPISRGQLPKELEEAAFSLKNGEYSKPIKIDKGYSLLYLIERRERSPEELKRLEEIVMSKIKEIEHSRKVQAEVEKKIEELREKTKIEVFYDRIPQ